MALLDMGAEHHFYGSDITCSYPVSLSICIQKLILAFIHNFSVAHLLPFWAMWPNHQTSTWFLCLFIYLSYYSNNYYLCAYPYVVRRSWGISSIQLVTLSSNWSNLLGSTLTLFLLVQINGKFTSDQSLIYNVSALY